MLFSLKSLCFNLTKNIFELGEVGDLEDENCQTPKSFDKMTLGDIWTPQRNLELCTVRAVVRTANTPRDSSTTVLKSAELMEQSA